MKLRLEETFHDIYYMIIDEKSMVGLRLLGLIDQRLKAAKPSPTPQFFGGLSILLVGDFAQLEPVADTVMISTASVSEELKVCGQRAYASIATSVKLTQLQRQNGTDASTQRFIRLLNHARSGACDAEDLALINSRMVSNRQIDFASFCDALHLCPTKLKVTELNDQRLFDNCIPVVKIKAMHSGRNAHQRKEEDCRGLAKSIIIGRGCRIMITANLWTAAGIVNGATGTVKDIIWGDDCTDHRNTFPSVIMVKLDSFTMTTPFGSRSDPTDCNWVPIPSCTQKWYNGAQQCSRRQFPIRLAYAMTIHKSQGLTLDKVKLYIEGKRDRQNGLTYTALSRVRRIDDIIIMTPINQARLDSLKNAGVEQRLRDESNRYPQQ